LVLDTAAYLTDEDSLKYAMENSIESAHQDPHSAYKATRILVSFYNVNHRLHEVADYYILGALHRAKQIGRRIHAALDMETEQLLSSLEVTGNKQLVGYD